MITKKILCFLVCVLLAVSVCGCGKNNISAQELTSDVMKSINKDATQVSSLKSDDLNGYFGLDSDKLEDFSVCISISNESAFEIGAFTVKKEDDRNALIDGINNHCNSVAASFRLINEAAYNTVQKHLLMELGNTVIYVISDNYAEAEKTLSKLGAKEIK